MRASLTGAALAQTTKWERGDGAERRVSPDRVTKTLDLPNFQNYLGAHRTRLLAKALKSAGVSAARSGDELADQMSPLGPRPPAIAKGPHRVFAVGASSHLWLFGLAWVRQRAPPPFNRRLIVRCLLLLSSHGGIGLRGIRCR
jgi:hypothetical protein